MYTRIHEFLYIHISYMYVYACLWQRGSQTVLVMQAPSIRWGVAFFGLVGPLYHLFANQVQEPYDEESLTRFMMRHRRGIKGRIKIWAGITSNVVPLQFPSRYEVLQNAPTPWSYSGPHIRVLLWGPAPLCDLVQEGAPASSRSSCGLAHRE